MRIAFLWSALVLAAPMTAFAQGEETPPATEEKPAEETTAAPAEAVDTAKAAAPAEEVKDEPFQIRRGFFAEADLGVYFTFGGRNTNDVNPENPFPKKGISNVQPYLALTAGYDLVHSEGFALSAGLRLGAGYSGGAGRVDDSELTGLQGSADDAKATIASVSTKPSDFAVIEMGAALAAAIFVSQRVAITVKADGGIAAVDPNPTAYAADPGAASATFAPIIGGGLGVEYFTLLNDFSVGLDLRFAMVLVSGSSIPSASISAPIKYTF